MRGKVIIGGIIALMVLIGVVVSQRRQIVEIRKEKATYQRNFETATSGIESYRKANGELVAKVNVLELKSSELGRYSVKLEQDIKDLNIKLKNAKAAKVIEYVYIYKTDTILITETAPNRYFASLTDEWIKLEQWISVDTDGTQLVAVRRTDIDLDSKQGRELAIADNATSKANLQWEPQAIAKIEEGWGVVPADWGIPEFDEPEEPEEPETPTEISLTVQSDDPVALRLLSVELQERGFKCNLKE